jgi:hypothetical protein
VTEEEQKMLSLRKGNRSCGRAAAPKAKQRFVSELKVCAGRQIIRRQQQQQGFSFDSGLEPEPLIR